MALVEKEAAAEIQIIGDTYDQTLWLHCSSWWPAHLGAWVQLAASDLRNWLPWGAIGKLWTQGLSLHHTEQDLSFGPSHSSANLSLVLPAEWIHSRVTPSRLAEAHCKHRAAFKIITLVANPLCPLPIFLGLDFLIPKVWLWYPPLTLPRLCFFVSDFRLVCSCFPGPFYHLGQNFLLWLLALGNASPAPVLMPVLFLPWSALTWHEDAFWGAKGQAARG